MVLTIIVSILLIYCAAIAQEAAPQTPAKQPTVQDLLNQRTALQLQIQGAMAARNAVDEMISKGKVDIELLSRQIEAMTPKPKAEVQGSGTPNVKVEPTKEEKKSEKK